MTVVPADRVTLLAVDPEHLLVAWTLAATTRVHRLRALADRARGAKLVVEVRAADGGLAVVEAPPNATEVRVAARADTTYEARVGFRLADGGFAVLVASAPAHTPPCRSMATGPGCWVVTAAPTTRTAPPPVRGTYEAAPATKPPGASDHHVA